MILFNTTVVLLSFNRNTIFVVLFDPIVSNNSIRSKPILCENLYAKLFILSDLVHHDIWVRTDGLNTNSTFNYGTQLDLCFSTSLDFDAWTFNIGNCASQDLGIRVDTLNIDAHKRALVELTVLNNDSVSSFRYQVQCTLLKK